MDTCSTEHPYIGLMPAAVCIGFWFMGTTSLVCCTIFPRTPHSLHRHTQDMQRGSQELIVQGSRSCAELSIPSWAGALLKVQPSPRVPEKHPPQWLRLHWLPWVTSGCHLGSFKGIISKWCHEIKYFGKGWLCFCIFSVVATVGNVGESVGSVISLHVGLILSPHWAIEFNIYS